MQQEFLPKITQFLLVQTEIELKLIKVISINLSVMSTKPTIL